MIDPIYLLACGILWRKVADVEAGGELAHALSDGDPDIRLRLLARHLLVAVCPVSTLLPENAISSGVRLPMEAPQCESQTAKAQLNYAAYAADQREIAEILIIDDEDEVLVKLEEVLEAAGYRTTTTWCARQAAKLLEEKQFDLILLDDYLGGTDWRYVLRGLCQK
jgi:PleD family two-component response regulator